MCFRHMPSKKSVDKNKKKRGNQKRHSAPPASSSSKKNRLRSPLPKTQNGTNGNHSDEYETPKKVFRYF